MDYLLNIAAIYAGMRMEHELPVDIDYYKRFMGVNLQGALIMTRAGYKYMQQGARLWSNLVRWRRDDPLPSVF